MLSVVIPVLNGAETLQAQLDAVIPQLGQEDELVLLNDGSEDATGSIMLRARHRNVTLAHRLAPSGVCEAYNWCVKDLAKGEWLFPINARNIVEPGAIATFKDALKTWPNAKIMIGQVGWATETRFLSPKEVRERLMGKHPGSDGPVLGIEGQAVFIRRDAWGEGYNPKLRWYADWWLYHLAVMRHGCVYLQPPIAARRGFGYGKGNENPVLAKEVAQEVVRLMREQSEELRAAMLMIPQFTGFFQVAA